MQKPDQMVFLARLRALKLHKEFMEKWGEFPDALPQGGGIQRPENQEQPFNQAENPARGGLSPEGRTPGVSDRINGQDSFGNDA